MSKLDWSQAICEACWIKQEGNFDAEDNLTAIRMPVVLIASERTIEVCAWCGEPTIMGIFKRVDPSTVPWPREKVE